VRLRDFFQIRHTGPYRILRYYLECGWRGCPAELQQSIKTELEYVAGRDGWKTVKGEAYCPDHAPHARDMGAKM
jgi:hypothetical protein